MISTSRKARAHTSSSHHPCCMSKPICTLQICMEMVYLNGRHYLSLTSASLVLYCPVVSSNAHLVAMLQTASKLA